MTEREKWENNMIAKQPAFNSKDEAISYSLNKLKEDDELPEVFRSPDGGKFIAAGYQAFETLVRRGFKRVAGMEDLLKIRDGNTEKKVATTFRDIKAGNDGEAVQ